MCVCVCVCARARAPWVDHGPVVGVPAEGGIEAQVGRGDQAVVGEQQGVADHPDGPVPSVPAPAPEADDAVEEDWWCRVALCRVEVGVWLGMCV